MENTDGSHYLPASGGTGGLPYNDIHNFTYNLDPLPRVAKLACPRVLDDQKMSEDNQNLRCGCPPDYQIYFGVKKYLKIVMCQLIQGITLSFPISLKYQFDN